MTETITGPLGETYVQTANDSGALLGFCDDCDNPLFAGSAWVRTDPDGRRDGVCHECYRLAIFGPPKPRGKNRRRS